MDLYPCVSCSRHIADTELSCPFCGKTVHRKRMLAAALMSAAMSWACEEPLQETSKTSADDAQDAPAVDDAKDPPAIHPPIEPTPRAGEQPRETSQSKQPPKKEQAEDEPLTLDSLPDYRAPRPRPRPVYGGPLRLKRSPYR